MENKIDKQINKITENMNPINENINKAPGTNNQTGVNKHSGYRTNTRPNPPLNSSSGSHSGHRRSGGNHRTLGRMKDKMPREVHPLKKEEGANRKQEDTIPPLAKGNIRIVPLGGVEEIGKNMTMIEYGDDIILIDIGFQFKDENTPGITNKTPPPSTTKLVKSDTTKSGQVFRIAFLKIFIRDKLGSVSAISIIIPIFIVIIKMIKPMIPIMITTPVKIFPMVPARNVWNKKTKSPTAISPTTLATAPRILSKKNCSRCFWVLFQAFFNSSETGLKPAEIKGVGVLSGAV
jgi:hypothetical protein